VLFVGGFFTIWVVYNGSSEDEGAWLGVPVGLAFSAFGLFVAKRSFPMFDLLRKSSLEGVSWEARVPADRPRNVEIQIDVRSPARTRIESARAVIVGKRDGLIEARRMELFWEDALADPVATLSHTVELELPITDLEDDASPHPWSEDLVWTIELAIHTDEFDRWEAAQRLVVRPMSKI
jgi:hypothetical protein